MTAEPDTLDRLTQICASLPEVTQSGEQHTAFLVRGRTFVYHLVDHHGDGRVALNLKVAAGENEALVAADPERYFIPAYVGPRGWVGLDLEAGCLESGEPDWDEVRALVVGSYRLVAPKSLARQVEAERGAD